ncbi:component of the polarisome [Scheffersomyces spartinae]|uniref:Component of the polarisome n=1 Tax=Scheffersomyces spartinae TaxID=45513 RepID=A0A9P7VDQ1_9ASCO|nr:component of the polarisome [Scheffersomyces spartinae]KAG7195892.1 component of the polarisome [Scheffersomyces spartinae]
MKDNGLDHHYRVLKQFLDISEDQNSRAKPLSTRAQRAREKLLKLSEAQFKELSTDVYDELRRRIDESRSEPDFLLPKLSFHPKRNQARQKLSALPQARFKDLVCDIAYEIERRNLNTSTTSSHGRIPSESSTLRKLTVGDSASNQAHSQSYAGSHQQSNAGSPTTHKINASPLPVVNLPHDNFVHSPTDTHHTSSPTDLYHGASGSEAPIGLNDLADISHSTTANDITSPLSESSAIGKSSINVLSKTVVPVKANLAWSSDEEEEEQEKDYPVRSDLLPEKQEESQGIDYSVLKNEFEDLNTETSDDFAYKGIQKRELEHEINPRNVSLEGSLYNAHKMHHDDDDDEEEEEEEEVPVQRGLFNVPIASPASATHTTGAPAPIPVPVTLPAPTALNKSIENDGENLELRSKLSALEKDYNDLQEKHKAAQAEYDNYKIDNENLSHEVGQLRKALSLHQEESAKTIIPTESVEFKELSQNFDQLKLSNAALNLELQALKTKHKQLEARAEKDNLLDTQDSSNQKPLEPPAIVSNSLGNKGGWDVFLEKLENIEVPNKVVSKDKPASQRQLQKQVINWQQKYEHLRANKIATFIKDKMLDQKAITSLVSPSGLISVKMVSELQSLIESYLLYISEEAYEPEILFDKISKLSILANEVAIQGDNYKPNSNEYSVLLRDAASYALTATRYLASHQSFLPKIIVERAVCEIGFALCDLASASKLNEHSALSREVSLKRHNPARNTIDEEFGVRPLRMANKLRGNTASTLFTTADEHASASGITAGTIEQDDNAPIVSQQLNAYKADPKQIRLGQVPIISNTNKPLNDDHDCHDDRRETVSTFESGSDYDADILIGHRSPVIAKIHNGVGDFSPFKEEAIINTPNATMTSSPMRGNDQEMPVEEETPFRDSIKSKDHLENSRELYNVHVRDSLNNSSGKIEEDSKEIDSFKRDPILSKSSPGMKKSTLTQKLEKFKDSNDEIKSAVETPRKDQQTSKISDLANRFETSRASEEKSPLKSANGLPSAKVSPAIAKLTSKLSGKSDDLPEKSPSNGNARKDSESFLDRVKRFEVTPTKPKGTSHGSSSQESLAKSVQFESPTNERKIKPSITDVEEKNEFPVTREKSFLGKLRDRLTGETPAKPASEDVVEKNANTTTEDDSSDVSVEKSSLNSSIVKENTTDDTDESPDKITQILHVPEQKYLNKLLEVDSVAVSEATFGQPDSFHPNLVSFSNSPEISSSRTTLSSLTSRADNFEDSSLGLLSVSHTNSALNSNLNRNGSKSNGKKVNILEEPAIVTPSQDYDSEYDTEQSQEDYGTINGDSSSTRGGEAEARQRQEYRKSMAAATFNIKLFDINDPDNTVTQVLLYLEHQTVKVISTIQSLLSAIKKQGVTRGELSTNAEAITIVITQMTEATNTSMNQTRNYQLKEHGNWVVKSLEDCCQRMNALTHAHSQSNDDDFADKNFKQRLAGISFDIAKCTKELVKSVEEASLKEEIDQLNAKLSTSVGEEWEM